MVNFLDPVGVGARDLRECLLIQICAQQGEAAIVLRRRQMTLRQNGCDEWSGWMTRNMVERSL